MGKVRLASFFMLLSPSCGGTEPTELSFATELHTPETVVLNPPPRLVFEPPEIRFESDRDATFECRIAESDWEPCTSPLRRAGFDRLGSHRLEIRATSGVNVDPSPERIEFIMAMQEYPDLALVEWGGGWRTRDIGRSVFERYADDYDWLIFWPDYVPNDPDGAIASGGAVDRRIGGLGFSSNEYDKSAHSDGRLQGIVWMNEREVIEAAEGCHGHRRMGLLAMEVGHRWLMRLDGPDGVALRGPQGSHWSPLVGLDAPSPLHKSCPIMLTQVSEGVFSYRRLTDVPVAYSSVDLYAMGLLPPEEVPDFFVVHGSGTWEYNFDNQGDWGADFPATRQDLSIQDLIDVNGPRLPAFEDAPKRFKMAFVVVVKPGREPSVETLEFVEQMRTEWVEFFPRATRGLGLVDTSL